MLQLERSVALVRLVKELRLGLAPLEVIRWATLHGAELMGLGEEAGLIEAGRLADLVIVDGDPTIDIGCLGDRENLRAVLLGGEWVDNRLNRQAAQG